MNEVTYQAERLRREYQVAIADLDALVSTPVDDEKEHQMAIIKAGLRVATSQIVANDFFVIVSAALEGNK